jgi:hypothetical protein
LVEPDQSNTVLGLNIRVENAGQLVHNAFQLLILHTLRKINSENYILVLFPLAMTKQFSNIRRLPKNVLLSKNIVEAFKALLPDFRVEVLARLQALCEN